MNGLAVARPEFDSLNVPALVQRHRQNEVAEQILAFGRHGKRLGHGQNQVGLPEMPAVRKARRRRPFARIALDGTRLDPIAQRLDFLVVEPPLPLEMPELGVRLPGRHEAMLGRRHDLRRPLSDVVVVQQRERRGFTRPVARRAVLKNDGGDVPVEGEGTLGGFDGSDGGTHTRLRRRALTC
jgi:hypothetical protein